MDAKLGIMQFVVVVVVQAKADSAGMDSSGSVLDVDSRIDVKCVHTESRPAYSISSLQLR